MTLARPLMPTIVSRALGSAALALLAAMPVAQAQLLYRAASAPIERGVGVYDGRSVAFQVIDGWAVVEGDIIIGRANELRQALRWADTELPRKSLTVGYQEELWLRGASGVVEVPYKVTADPEGNVVAAITAFNATFAGVIQFVARTTQADYVDFAMDLPPPAPACSSGIGRIGGRQLIIGPPDCPVGVLLHEMGHAIGLLHEHSRFDRDQYILWQPQNTAKNARLQSAIEMWDRKVVAPYDYGSIMHYSDFDFSANGQPTYVTIPPGIEIGQIRGFTGADVDTVRRLYGMAPTSVTVTSAPAGLTVIVDGESVTTPKTYAWPIGSTHTIDVPTAPQSLSSVPYLFGRWNVDVVGDQLPRREIRVDPGPGSVGMPASSPAVTVYTANFVRYYAFTLTIDGDTAAARAATAATASPLPQALPGLAGLYFRANQPVTLSASTNAPTSFGGWFGSNFLPIVMGYASPTLAIYATDSTDLGGATEASAYGSQAPLVRLRARGDDGSVDGHRVTIDGASERVPYTSSYPRLSGVGAHQVTAVSPQYRAAATTRYTFKDWDGSTANPISVTRPASGQPSRDITANFAAQHLVTTEQTNPCAGVVSIANPSVDDYYDHGRVIALNVVPSPGWHFVGWSDDLSGTAASQSIQVNGEVYATASYNLTPERLAVTGISRLFAVAGDPHSPSPFMAAVSRRPALCSSRASRARPRSSTAIG